MNYRHIYMCIIAHAKLEQQKGLRPLNGYHFRKYFKDSNLYFEFHHILPRSLFPNWIKRKSNIVPLTAREHFFCHQLLTKIYFCKETVFAAWMLSTSKCHNHAKISSKEYENLRKQQQNFRSENSIQIHRNMSIEKKKERALKISKARKGMIFTEETRKNISISHIGQKSWNKGISNEKTKLGNLKGIQTRQNWTEERKLLWKKKISETKQKQKANGTLIKGCHKGFHWYNNGIKEASLKKCPDGWVPGRLLINSTKGTKWVNNGLIQKRVKNLEEFLKNNPTFRKGQLK